MSLSVSEHVWIGGGGRVRGWGGDWGSYQPGVYVPLKALFLVYYSCNSVDVIKKGIAGSLPKSLYQK